MENGETLEEMSARINAMDESSLIQEMSLGLRRLTAKGLNRCKTSIVALVEALNRCPTAPLGTSYDIRIDFKLKSNGKR